MNRFHRGIKGLAPQLCAPQSKAMRRLARPPRGSATKSKPKYPMTKPIPPNTRAYRACIPNSLCLDSRAHSNPQHLLLCHMGEYKSEFKFLCPPSDKGVVFLTSKSRTQKLNR